MLLSCAVNAPVRHIVINSGGRLPEALADCLVRIANGKASGKTGKKSEWEKGGS